MKRDEDYFGEEELELVHISRKLREARAVEALLTELEIDYLAEARTFRTTLLLVIPVDRIGAYFYVRIPEAPGCRETLTARGHTIVEVELE